VGDGPGAPGTRQEGISALRICSLVPSATEIVASVGRADWLVGVSDECDFPPAVRALPAVSSSRIDPAGLSSFEIDEAVRRAVAEGRSLYAVDEELLDSLEPDLILTQDLCAVCAVSSGELCGLPTPTLAVDAHSLDEIRRAVLRVASLLGVADVGRAVVARMDATIAEVERRVAGAPRPRVFVAEWLDPPFAAGHWVPEMVALAGGEEILGRPRARSYETTWNAVCAAEPDLVVVAPCGFDHRRAAREADLPDLGCRVVAVDANAYYARPAPRVADGVAQLAFLIHPELVEDPGLPYVELVT
jgi:iron complex transport system substrate-binding protein